MDNQTHAGTILLAEDQEMIRSLVVQTLRAAGYTVLEAPNGQEALQLAQVHAGRLDLLISNVVMPEMTGVELAQRIQERWPGLPVLFMSGYSAEACRQQGIETLEHPLLEKPFGGRALRERVEQVLAGRADTGTSGSKGTEPAAGA